MFTSRAFTRGRAWIWIPQGTAISEGPETKDQLIHGIMLFQISLVVGGIIIVSLLIASSCSFYNIFLGGC